MRRTFTELIKKYGPGLLLGAVTFYIYRRQVMKNRNNK